MFLTAAELVTLTGYRKPSAQIRWLRENRVRHKVNGAGHPVVVRDWLIDRDAPRESTREAPRLHLLPGKA